MATAKNNYVNILFVNVDGNISTLIADAYESYSFSQHYDSFCSTFMFTMVDNDITVGLGWLVLADIDEKNIFLSGIIEKRTRNLSKNSRTISFLGKDIGSKLVERYIDTPKDYNNETPMDIITDLIDLTDYFIKPKADIDELSDDTNFNDPDDLIERNIAVQNDSNASNTLPGVTGNIIYSEDFKALSTIAHFKTSIGDTVFDKVVELVTMKGFEIYQEDSNIYIGDRAKKRNEEKPQISYNIYCYPTDHKDNYLNNVISSSFSEDISNRYSSVQVSSQSEANYGNTKIAIDSTLPHPKFFAENVNSSTTDGEKLAVQIREQQRRSGYQLSYKVNGHIADNGYEWKINHIVHVKDFINNIDADLVIYGVTFLYNKNDGHTTGLILSLPKNDELKI
jgi:prophage tail gpP-like protein